MPLTAGDVQIVSIVDEKVRTPAGQFVDAKAIKIRVRESNETTIFIPRAIYTAKTAEDMIRKEAQDIIDLIDKFATGG
jgi:hypothetical protein